jgi:hypothetical protein
MPNVYSLLLLLIVSTCTAQDCQVRPEPKAFIDGKPSTIDEKNFNYERSGGLSYYTLNKEKHVLYIPNFLNETASEEIKTFCVEGERFTQSRIRGHGDGSTVEKNDLRTR